MDLRRRFELLKRKEDEEMKEWIELENLTISEPQKFTKIYDSSYSDYICEIRIPKGNGTIQGKFTQIFGNYGLYFKNLATTESYPFVATVGAEKMIEKTYLMSCAFGADSGSSDFKNKTIKIVDNVQHPSYVNIDCELPTGSTIRVWGR